MMKLVFMLSFAFFYAGVCFAGIDVPPSKIKENVISKLGIEGDLKFEKRVLIDNRDNIYALIYSDDGFNKHIIYSDNDYKNLLIGFESVEYSGLVKDEPEYNDKYELPYDSYFEIKNGMRRFADQSIFENKDLFYFSFKGNGNGGTLHVLNNWLVEQAEGGWSIFDYAELAELKYLERFSEIRVYPVAREEVSPTAKATDILISWKETASNMRYEWTAEDSLEEWCDENWQKDIDEQSNIELQKYIERANGKEIDEEDDSEEEADENDHDTEHNQENEPNDEQKTSCKIKIYRKLLKNGILLKNVDFDITGDYVYKNILYPTVQEGSFFAWFQLFSEKKELKLDEYLLENNTEKGRKNLVYEKLMGLGYAKNEIADISFAGSGKTIFQGAQGCKNNECKSVVIDHLGQYLFTGGHVVTLDPSKQSSADNDKKCPKDGERYPADFTYCPKHGVQLGAE